MTYVQFQRHMRLTPIATEVSFTNQYAENNALFELGQIIHGASFSCFTG